MQYDFLSHPIPIPFPLHAMPSHAMPYHPMEYHAIPILISILSPSQSHPILYYPFPIPIPSPSFPIPIFSHPIPIPILSTIKQTMCVCVCVCMCLYVCVSVGVCVFRKGPSINYLAPRERGRVKSSVHSHCVLHAKRGSPDSV